MTKEQKFYKALEDLFIGAKIEGEGGFVNLMQIKSSYYSKIREHLEKDIEKALEKYPKFREELFDKLYSFFSRYFTKSGSIYFNYTPFFQNVYDKVYTDDKDVILFWKTRMLYYVKTDRIFKNLKIEIEDKNETYQFFFDVSNLEYKKANEKRSLIYELKKVSQDNTIFFNVFYSEKGRQTNYDDIKKELKQKGIKITDEVLDKAFSTFEAQSEVDYFINKNAKEFLQEQFKIWLYQYIYSEETEWPKERIDQLQILKDIAFKIIDFISQFEDELVRIWNKPKFVLNSNYVITLDRIAKKNGFEIIEKIQKHKNFNEQVKEWEELGILEKEPGNLLEKTLTGLQLKKEYQFLPIDTKYFKDLELEILFLFDDLDQSLDGWLIKSENYQALKTILPKFREKVQTIYIDPPFNTGEDFIYVDKFQDSTWLTLMRNRIEIAKEFLRNTGSIFLHLDWNADYLGRFLLDEIFGKDNFLNEIIWRIGWVSGYKTVVERFVRNHDVLLFYAARDKNLSYFNKNKAKIPYISFKKDIIDTEIKSILKKWKIEKKDIKNIKIIFKDNQGNVFKIGLDTKEGDYPIEDTWNSSEYEELHSNKIKRNAKEYTPNGAEITQKPEQLLKRIIETTTKEKDIIFDFFLGTATSIAVAKKLNRKWIGVEIGNYFYSDCLYRMKHVLAGNTKREPCGISKETNWQGGGFFKYYELEQYEDVLRKAKYEDSDLFNAPNQSPYEQYIFLKDKKLLDALEIDYKKNKVKVDLSKLYKNIDIAETLSNLKGKWIKRITENEVELADYDEEGKAKNIEKVDLKNLNYKEIKKLIWW
jgi:adenine specific DNA methylase Mod